MSEGGAVVKQCHSGRVHRSHLWWSRRQHCYFRCFGRREPRRSIKEWEVIPPGGDLSEPPARQEESPGE